MKTSVVRIMRILMAFSFGLIGINQINAQGIQSGKKTITIGSYPIRLSDNKTTNIIFPYAIKSVDRGSGDVLVQVVQGFGNIIQLKANAPDFKQTNVTVITSDGKFYSFLVDYNSDPKALNLSFIQEAKGKDSNNLQNIALPNNHYNDAVLDNDCSKIKQAKSFLHQKIKQQRMKLTLAGIYLKDGLMWFKLSIKNGSQVDYDLDNISFSITDKKQAKRTARQEIELHPIYTKLVQTVRGNTENGIILSFKPVTIPKTKLMRIQISDKTGGRNLMMTIKAKKLLRARWVKVSNRKKMSSLGKQLTQI